MKSKKCKFLNCIKRYFLDFMRWTWPFIVLIVVFFFGYIFIPRESWISLSSNPERVDIHGFTGGVISSFSYVSINHGFLFNSDEILVNIDGETHHVEAGQLIIAFGYRGTHGGNILVDAQNQISLYTAGNQQLNNVDISIRSSGTPQAWHTNYTDGTTLSVSFDSIETNEMILSFPIGKNIRLHGAFDIFINNVQIQTPHLHSIIEIVERIVFPDVINSLFRLHASDFSISIFYRNGDDFILWGDAASFKGNFGYFGSLRHTYIGVQNYYNISNIPVMAVKYNYLLSVTGEFRQEASHLSISGLVSEINIAGASLHFNIRQFIFLNFNSLFLGVVAVILAKSLPEYFKKKAQGEKLND